jgi:thiamine-phosphate pyrophosphorylase
MAEMPECRLYLQFPMQPSASLSNRLAHVLDSTDSACVLLCPDQSPLDETAAGLVEFVQGRGLACLIAGDAPEAARLKADGVHLEADPTIYSEARKRLGPQANIGAACGLNRHDAMLLAELGADYVAFGAGDVSDIDAINPLSELITWWSEIFVVPCVAWNIASAEDAGRYAALGADFVAPALDLWRTEDGLQMIAEIDRAVRQSRRAA